jgi:chromosome segregation ATPase
MAAAQTAMQQSLNGNHDQVAGRLAGLAESQQRLQTDVDSLNAKTDKAVADSDAAVSSLHETLRVSRDVVTGQMAASLQNQQAIQTAVQDLHGKTDGLTANLAAVSAEQTAVRETSGTHHDAILTAMASDQKALQETTRSNQEALVGRLGDLSKHQADLLSELNALNGKADAVSTELSAAAQRQSTLQQTVGTGNEALAAHATTVAENHQNLRTAVADLDAKTRQVSADLAAIASVQDGFCQTQQSHNETMTTRTAGLAEGQQALRGQVDLLTATTSQTALSMLTLNNGQATFQQTMQAGMNGLHERADQTAVNVKGMVELNSGMSQSLAAQAATLADNQQTMKSDLTRMAGIVDRAYADLTAVSLAQDTLQNTLASRSDEISGRVARIDGNQKELAESLNILTATASQTALDVMGLATGHADLHRSIKAGNDAVLTRTATLAENQGTLGSQLDILTATTSQTAADVIGVTDRHNGLARAVQNHSDSTDSQMATITENQQTLGSQLDILNATTSQTAADVIGMSDRQSVLAKAVRNHSDSAGNQMAKLAEGNQQVQSGLDVLTATAGQTAMDVIAVTNRQDALAKAIRSHDESTNGRIATLDGNQQKMQSGLDAVTATAGQTVRDIASLNETQAKSEQTAQAGRGEVVAKLGEIAQSQQGWLQRFDAAQARIQSMADGIATLDQQLGNLQGVLQTGVQNTTTLLDANGQQRQQFEAKIAQDVQAMIDAISQLRQTQAQLQEQMSQVQKSTQSQTDTLKTTIEQLKAAPQQLPIEVKVSDAAKPVEPAVVQTGE